MRTKLVWFGLGLILLAGCTNSAGSYQGHSIPLITTADEVDNTLDKARSLELNSLVKADAGQKLNDQEIDDLKESAALWEGVIKYDPGRSTAYIGAAQVYNALGDYDHAIQQFKQCIANAARWPERTEKQTRDQIVAESYYRLSVIYSRPDHKDLHEAESRAATAAVMFPNNPTYLAQAALAEDAIGNSTEAMPLVIQALALDANNQVAIDLAKKLKIDIPKPKKPDDPKKKSPKS